MKFTVEMRDVRAAMLSVAPHMSGDAEQPAVFRMRVTVEEHAVTFMACDRFTAALALCSVTAHERDPYFGVELGTFDLHPADAKNITHLFRPGKGDDSQWLLQFSVTDSIQAAPDADGPLRRVSVTDVSGLVHGDTLEVTALPHDDGFPDLPKAFARWLDRSPDLIDDLAVMGHQIAKFRTAAVCYAAPLLLSRRAKTPLIVHCAEEFLGAIMPAMPADMAGEEARRRHSEWVNRLPASSTVTDLDTNLNPGHEDESE